MNGQRVGYARVSAVDQNEARQLEALKDVDKLFTEKASGGSRKRPVLDECMAYLRDGDVLVVKSIDRLARSTRDLLAIVDELHEQGVAVEFVDTPALNTNAKEGRFVMTILAAVAEMERATIRERQAEGIAIAKAKGVYDRPNKLTDEQIAGARRRIADGVSKTRVAKDLGVCRVTLYKALEGKGAYAGTA